MEEFNFEEYQIKPSPTLQIVVDNLWSAIRGFVDKYQKQLEQNRTLASENLELQNELEKLKERAKELEFHLQQQQEEVDKGIIEELRFKIQELIDENTRLQILCDEYKKEKEYFEGSIFGSLLDKKSYDELEKQVESLRQELREKETRIEELKNEIVGKENRINELSETLESLQNEKERIPVLEEKITEMQKMNTELHEKVVELNEQINDLAVQNNTLRKAKDELELLKVNISDLERNLEATVVAKIEREREIERLLNEIGNLRNKVAFAEEKEKLFLNSILSIFGDKSFSEIFSIEVEPVTFENIQKIMKQIVEKSIGFYREIVALAEENQRLKSLIDDLEKERTRKIMELEEEITYHKNRIAGLETELTQKEKERFELDKKLNEFLSYKEDEINELKDLKSENEKLKSSYEKIQNELLEKQKRLEEIVSQIEIYRRSIDDLNSQIELLNAENSENKKENNRLKQDLQVLKEELKRNEESIKELIQYKNEFYKIQSEVNSIKQINKEIKELNKQINDEKIELQRKVFTLNKEKNELEDKLAYATREREKIEFLYNEKILEFKNLNEEFTKLKIMLQEKERVKSILIEKIESLLGEIDNMIGN